MPIGEDGPSTSTENEAVVEEIAKSRHYGKVAVTEAYVTSPTCGYAVNGNVNVSIGRRVARSTYFRSNVVEDGLMAEGTTMEEVAQAGCLESRIAREAFVDGKV